MSSSSSFRFLKSHSPLLKSSGFWLACVGDRLLRLRDFFRDQIADRLDLDVLDCEQILQQTGTASADADDSQAHVLFCLERDADHRRVRALRRAGSEVRTQNVSRDEKSGTADRGALHETSSRNIFRVFVLVFVRWQLVTSCWIAIRSDGQ